MGIIDIISYICESKKYFLFKTNPSDFLSLGSTEYKARMSRFLHEHPGPINPSIHSTSVTVNDTVGDFLSLGGSDLDFLPAKGVDYGLLGVCNEVEAMLNKQLLQPVISHKALFNNRYQRFQCLGFI